MWQKFSKSQKHMAPLLKQVSKVPYASVRRKKWRRCIERVIAGGIAQDTLFKGVSVSVLCVRGGHLWGTKAHRKLMAGKALRGCSPRQCILEQSSTRKNQGHHTSLWWGAPNHFCPSTPHQRNWDRLSGPYEEERGSEAEKWGAGLFDWRSTCWKGREDIYLIYH